MTKKKLIITITSLCLVVVAAVAAVVGIIAATNVGINSNLSVSYTPGPEVIATVKGEYSVAGAADATLINETSFVYGDTKTTAAIDQAAVDLTDTNKYVIFAFTFKNDATTDNTKSAILTVEVTDNSEADKMTASVKYTKTAITAMNEDAFGNVTHSATALDSIGVGETGYVYVMVKIQDGVKGSWGTKGGADHTFQFALTAKAAA